MAKRYSPELKAQVVHAVLDEYRLVEDVQATFGVPMGTFGAWVANERNLRRQAAELERTKKESAPPAPSQEAVAKLGAEVRRQNTQNKILTTALGEIQEALVKAAIGLDNLE